MKHFAKGQGMSESDSFIEEVSEEVRRDKLFQLFRRYGWIAIGLVLLLVGGAAFREYRLAQDRAAAEQVGDQLMGALRIEDAAERSAALTAVEADGDIGAVVSLLQAATDQDAEKAGQARAQLEALAADSSLSPRYRDLAQLKLVLLDREADPASRIATLSPLAAPGAPYRLLAEEQIAMAEIDQGDVESAIARLRNIRADLEVTAGLRQRATDVIVALGADPEDDG